MFGIISAVIIAFLTLFIPGLFFSFALFQKTSIGKFEKIMIGFIFGIIATPTLTWLESYFINYIHMFSFSLGLFEANAVLLAIIGFTLCVQQGVFKFSTVKRSIFTKEEEHIISEEKKDFANELSSIREKLKDVQEVQSIIKKHIEEEQNLIARQQAELSIISLTKEEKDKITALHRKAYDELAKIHIEEERLYLKNMETEREESRHNNFNTKAFVISNWYWIILTALILITFYSRVINIAVSPTYFEFDPYFDMISSEYILTFGQQLLLDPSAWPVVAAGTNHRMQPLIPYLEAYWYDLANALKFHYTTFSTKLMSYVGSIYPPITAAMLVFVMFMLLYHEYDKHIALIGAGLAAMMPVLITTFIAGEQLLEPWGIFSLFFFFAAYLLAVKDPSNVRYAIFAGLAFASTFLGAHYYTVDAGVLAAYIIIQGILSVFRRDDTKSFYKMNAIVIAIIAVSYLIYMPYSATLTTTIPNIMHIPITISLPLFAFILVVLFEYLPKILKKYKIIEAKLDSTFYLAWFILLIILIVAIIFATPIGRPLRSYINLSARFTTPSSPLFMTVQEFEPSGLFYNFGASGFGALGYTFTTSNINTGIITSYPIALWLISAAAIVFILISIYRGSKTGIFYLATSLPIMFAGFSEVKYLPHLGVVEIMLFGIILGELMLLAQSNYKISEEKKSTEKILESTYKNHKIMFHSVLILGIFFLFGRAAMYLLLLYFIAYLYLYKKERSKYLNYMIGISILLTIISFLSPQFVLGESAPLLQTFSASYTYSSTSPSLACAQIYSTRNSVGYDMFCNQVPSYWLSATAWMRQNVGPYAPRILSWWDYGDWINWFGNSNAVIRGDNSVYKEDYATAANLVLGPSYNYTPAALANYMNTNQTKYLLVDTGIIEKWQALDFLACININATSEAFAKAQGALQNPPVPYVLGTSQCELVHDPVFILVPKPTLFPTNETNLSDYCSISNRTSIFAKSILVMGSSVVNQSACVLLNKNKNGVMPIYDSNGTKTDGVIQVGEPIGEISFSNQDFLEYLVIYLPGPNGTVVNPPTLFYTSNFYRAFILGNLPGFTQVYPENATGINFINGTYPIRIFALDNFTGKLPYVPQKPPWVHNNYSMP
ncbi:MAG: hypothetical protein ACP5TL_01915 [Candidatus Micrarchaeia archaeon]